MIRLNGIWKNKHYLSSPIVFNNYYLKYLEYYIFTMTIVINYILFYYLFIIDNYFILCNYNYQEINFAYKNIF